MYNASAKGANFSIWLAALMHLPHDTNKLRAEPQAHTCTWLLALNSAHYTAESKVGPVSYSPLFSLSCFLFSLSLRLLSHRICPGSTHTGESHRRKRRKNFRRLAGAEVFSPLQHLQPCTLLETKATLLPLDL